jgi:hypothetical protein
LKVCKLDKALYGVKQASRAWQRYLKDLFVEAGFTPFLKDEAVYVCWTPCLTGFCLCGTCG